METRDVDPADLSAVAAATDRLLMTVDSMTEPELREPSLLPGWTRAHVLTHVARNADGLCVLVENARSGSEEPMYPGGPAGRDAAIDAGAARGLGDLRLDLTDSAERFLEAFADFPPDASKREVRLRSGTAYGWEIPLLRLREVEIHHVDLGLAYRPDDWSDEFARRTLDQVAPTFLTDRDCPVARLTASDGSSWETGRSGPVLTGSPQHLLAWLLGRSDGGGLTSDGSGPIPAAPRWS
jgi:maleylpyruvate isomerase